MNNVFETNGAVSWTELMTDDVQAAKAFYGEVFNWTLEDQNMLESTYTVIKVGKSQIGGITKKSAHEEAMPSMWKSYITVSDVDETAARVERSGGKLLLPPTDIPTVGRIIVIQDPQGAVISAITYEKKA